MFRAVIIGTGRIGSLLEKDPLRPKPHSHAGWYRRHPRTTLVAGADINTDRLREFGQDWGLPAASLFTNYRVMLDTVRPDIVSVCAWAPERVDMAMAALATGARGLWLEKAVACSMGEASRLEDAIAAAGVAAIVDHPRRGVSEYRTVKGIIDEGRLGSLHTIHCLMSACMGRARLLVWPVARGASVAGGARPAGRSCRGPWRTRADRLRSRRAGLHQRAPQGLLCLRV